MKRQLAALFTMVLSFQLLADQSHPSEDCTNNSIPPLICRRVEGGKVAPDHRGGVYEVGIKADKKIYVSKKKNSSTPVEVKIVGEVTDQELKDIKKHLAQIKDFNLLPESDHRCTDLPSTFYIAAALEGQQFARKQSCVDHLPKDPKSKSAALKLKKLLDQISSKQKQ